jgi:hypothetical protein
MAKFSFRKKDNINIGRVVGKIATVLIALWVGGIIITTLGTVMTGTESPFYSGLALIGWTVGQYPAAVAGNYSTTCVQQAVSTVTSPTGQNCITNTTGSGVLSIVGLIGIASIVLEFVEIKLK